MKIRLALLSCLLAVAAFAADVTGKWTAEVPGRGGNTMTQTFTFKADGSTLTGSIAGGRGGEVSISNGKVDGDNISFDVTREFQGNSMTFHYTGKVSGDTLKLKMEREGGEPREITAKRASTT